MVISNLCNMQFTCKYICGHGFDWYIMSIIVSNCQHCDEQQFQTLSCVHYAIFSVVKLDLFIRALLLDRILALEKTTRTPHVHLVRVWYNNACGSVEVWKFARILCFPACVLFSLYDVCTSFVHHCILSQLNRPWIRHKQYLHFIHGTMQKWTSTHIIVWLHVHEL